MADTTSSDEDGGVLRPFEASAQQPLPPIEPSKVVPDVPAAAQVTPPTAAPEATIPPPPPVDAALHDQWAPEDATIPQPVVSSSDPPPGDSPVDVVHSVAGTLPDASVPNGTITLPRTPFLIGLAVLLVALAGLTLLWQSSGNDKTEVSAPPSTAPVVSEEPADEGPDDTAPPVDTSEFDAEIAGLNNDLATSQAEIAGLQVEVAQLEERPAPALSGDRLRRIIIARDAKFVSSQPDSVAVVGAFGGLSLIDPSTNRVVNTADVANGATRVMRTLTTVWITNYADNEVLRVAPATGVVAGTFPFEGPDGIAKDGDTIVVASYDGGIVARVDPSTGEIIQSVDVGDRPATVLSHPDHGLWTGVFGTGEIVQIDRDSFEIIQRVLVGAGPEGLSFDATHLWVANSEEGTIAKVDPVAGEVVLTVAVGAGPTELVIVDGSVWVTLRDEGSLVQVDAASGEIVTRTPLGGTSAGGGPTGISYGNGALWIAMHRETSVVRIDL